jgi:transcription antitermination factor NusG
LGLKWRQPVLIAVTEPNICWYALRIQSRFGKLVSATLRGKGYEDFLPTYKSCNRWSDRIKVIDTPLFPGYIFCRFDPKDRHAPILSTPGVIGFVGGRTLVPIPEAEIEAVRSIVRSGLVAQRWPYIGLGSRVFIEHGPLAGIEGVVTNADKIWRLVVSVSLLQRSIAVEINREWVRPASGESMAAKASE